MAQFPRISIVTPCFNHEKFIGETIESVVSQDYPNLQYVVIDDGSTDGSAQIISSFKDRLHKWETWEGHRPGAVWAINRGFSYTDGEIMGWISSDDILLPRSLFTLAKVFTDLPQVEWLTGVASTINLRSEVVQIDFFYKNLHDYLVGDWSVIQQESTFFRRALWDQAGGELNEDFVQAFDTELWTRFFQLTEHYHLLAPVGAFRNSQQSRSTRDPTEFLGYNAKALERLRHAVSAESTAEAKLFMYKTLRYSFPDDQWMIEDLVYSDRPAPAVP